VQADVQPELQHEGFCAQTAMTQGLQPLESAPPVTHASCAQPAALPHRP
jgi:hypothetical protein